MTTALQIIKSAPRLSCSDAVGRVTSYLPEHLLQDALAFIESHFIESVGGYSVTMLRTRTLHIRSYKSISNRTGSGLTLSWSLA